MAKFERETVMVKVDSFTPGILDGSLDYVISMFNGYKNEIESKGWTNASVSVEYDYEGCNEIYIYADRPETDEEYNARYEEEKRRLAKKTEAARKKAEKAKAAAEKAEAEERELYERLKAKFEA